MNKVIKNILLNCLPLVIVIPLSLLSSVKNFDYDITTQISTVQILFIALIMPIYLLFINIRYTNQNNKYLFLHRMLLMIVLEFISAQIHFFPWEHDSVTILQFISAQFTCWVSKSTTIDPETLLLMLTEWILPSLIILLAGCVFQIIRYLKYRKEK